MPKRKSKAEKPAKNRERIGSGFFSYRKSSYQKNLDNLQLLFSYPEFQKDVLSARAFLEIPPGGLQENAEKIREWYDRMIKKSDKMMNSSSFMEQERKINDPVKRKEIGLTMMEKQTALHYHRIPVNYLTNTSRFLTEKFHLPEHYADSIRAYIISNRVEVPTDNFMIGFSHPKSLNQMGHLEIKVYAELTDDDLKEIKHRVKHWIGKRLPRFQALAGIDKKLEVEEWLADRTRQDTTVTGETFRMTAKEIAQDVLGDKKKHKQVYEIPRQLKELRERRFGKGSG